MHRLYLRIYLAVLASLFLFVVLAGIAWKLGGEFLWQQRLENGPRQEVSQIIDQLAADLLPATADRALLQRRLDDWHPRLGIDLAIIAADGEVLAMAGQPMPTLPERWRDQDGGNQWDGKSWRSFDDHSLAAIALPGNRYLVGHDRVGAWSWRRRGGVLPLMGGLALIGLAVALAAWPLARRLTRRLEGLQSSVQQFGKGDLGSRVKVRGRDEIASLAQSFNESAQRIEALVNAQKSLLANASHELRSPLARIRLAAGLLEEGDDDTASSPAHAEIRRSINELDALIDEILLASRLDAVSAGGPPLTREPMDFGGLVAEECARLGLVPQGRAIDMVGDTRLLRRLVRNLLENAVRHGRPGDAAPLADSIAVQVAVRPAPAGAPDLLCLRVCDNGPGVPEQERERIFEPFYRRQGASERAGGVGLGLSLVRQIARAHQGTVTCQAREGGGSCFELLLPLAAGSPHARHA